MKKSQTKNLALRYCRYNPNNGVGPIWIALFWRQIAKKNKQKQVLSTIFGKSLTFSFFHS